MMIVNIAFFFIIHTHKKTDGGNNAWTLAMAFFLIFQSLGSFSDLLRGHFDHFTAISRGHTGSCGLQWTRVDQEGDLQNGL